MLVETEHTIVKAMQIEWHPNVQHGLATIYQSGLELFRLLHRQNAVFQVEMAPACEEGVPQHFHPVTMEDVNSTADEEALAGRTIDVSVFPLVYKSGDERGENVSIGLYKQESKVLVLIGDDSRTWSPSYRERKWYPRSGQDLSTGAGAYSQKTTSWQAGSLDERQ